MNASVSSPRRVRWLLTLAWGLCFPAAAQPYDVSWFTIDDGGGTSTSTGAVYAVSGAVGQADAGLLTGGSYTLVGGFWSVVAAVQTSGTPFLTVTRSNSTVTVSWPGAAGNFILEQTLGLAPAEASWTPTTIPYQTNGPVLFITEPLPGGSKFYRLRKL